MTAADNIAAWILDHGEDAHPAIVFNGQTISYAELRSRVRRWAAWLMGQGLQPGDRVGLLAENGPFFVVAYLAVIRAGLCVVPIPVDARDKAIASVVASTRMRLLLVSARMAARLAAVKTLGIPIAIEGGSSPSAEPPSAELPAAAVEPHVDPRRDLAAIMLTSGSTGDPKGVMVTHRNIECNTLDIVDYLGLSPRDRVMVVLPFYYCYGASLLHTHLAAGATLVISNRFMFPEKVLDEMVEHQCTGLAGVPSTYQILLRKTRFASRRFPSLAWLQQAGGRLPNPYLKELRQAMPEVKLFVMYGQTEATARLSYLPWELVDEKLGSIGRGLRSTRLEVLRPDGTPVAPGSDEVGEIVASGDNITPGYWNDPEETARYFHDGKLFTGDMARVDSDGFIYLVERARDFIKAMGHRVSPKEVEEVLAEMPEVVEAAVLGMPHEIWGEAIRAFIVARRAGELSAAGVRRYCLGRLPNFKIPESVVFLPQLPKMANGKVAREELKRLAARVDATPAGPVNAE